MISIKGNIVKCPMCNKEFVKTADVHIYCSRICKNRYYRLKGICRNSCGIKYDKTCPECGKPFTTSYRFQKYCCKVCKENVNGRIKYHRDKREHPDRAERHRLRRARNIERTRKQWADNGLCVRCGGRKESDNKICDNCLIELGRY